MAFSGAQVTRLGLYGGGRSPYGSFAGKSVGVIIEEETRKTGGLSKRAKARKHKQVMIDGKVHVVNTPEEEYFLLQGFLDKVSRQHELDLLKKKTPIVKRNIKMQSNTITRTENRIEKVSEEMKWRQKIRQEDEEILVLLTM